MHPKHRRKLSKLMSTALRHKPKILGITVDEQGWADLTILVKALAAKDPLPFPIRREHVQEVVATSDKQRFCIQGNRIRANQGHTLAHVQIDFQQVNPPPRLFHGTARRCVKSILSQGLRPMRRQYVHLSADLVTARKVGARHDPHPVIFEIAAARAAHDGVDFFISQNNVYLVKQMAPGYLTLLYPPS